MLKSNLSNDDYRQGFEEYLESLSYHDRMDIGFIENDLAEMLRRALAVKIPNIFSIRDTNFFLEALRKLRRNEETKMLLNGRGSQYLKGLKLLNSFYGSNFLPGRKLKSNPRKKKFQGNHVISNTAVNELIPTVQESKVHTEGARKELEMERAYRNREARNECIRIWGAQCQVCGIKFKDHYGDELGDGFIEVHHLVPISTREEEYEVDPAKDLVPLCSNCHSMIHRGGSIEPLSLSELRDKYKGPFTPIDKLMEP